MNRRLTFSRKGSHRGLLTAALGLLLLFAAAISVNAQARPAALAPLAASGITQAAEAILPKIERENRVRVNVPTPDGDDVPPLLAEHEGLSFPMPAQASLPDPPFGLQAAPHLSTRSVAPRAPPVSV